MLDFGMCEQILRSRHDFGHTGFVVGTEQSSTVRRDQRMPFEERQLGEIRYTHSQLLVQTNIAAIIVFDDLRLHVLAAHVGGSIHMCNESDHGRMLTTGRGRDAAHDIAVLVHFDLAQAEVLHLFGQMTQQHQLLVRRGESGGGFVALRIEAYISEKSLF